MIKAVAVKKEKPQFSIRSVVNCGKTLYWQSLSFPYFNAKGVECGKLKRIKEEIEGKRLSAIWRTTRQITQDSANLLAEWTPTAFRALP